MSDKIDFKGLTWVINNLPEKDMKEVDKMDAVTFTEVNNFVTAEIENGGQFSAKYDDYSDCMSVSLVYLEKGNINTGYAVSARGKDYAHCISILMYKFYQVAKTKLCDLTESRQKRPKYG